MHPHHGFGPFEEQQPTYIRAALTQRSPPVPRKPPALAGVCLDLLLGAHHSGETGALLSRRQHLFRVTPADGAAPSQEALFSAIRKLGYKPGLAEVSAFRSTPEPVHPARDVPDAVQKALDRAKPGGKKFVLVDCMGDD